MMRYTTVLMLASVAVVAAVVAGCSKAREAAQTAQHVGQAAKFAHDMEKTGEATIKTDEGEAKVAVAKEGDEVTSMTVTGKDGQKATFTSGAKMDVSKTGIEPYPGAQQEGGGGVEGGEATVGLITLTTTDSFEKVATFYKGKYPEAEKMEASGGGTETLTLQISPAPSARTVMVSKDADADKVNIVLMSNIEASAPE